MTQQPDPFSELRGLMAEATPGPWEVTYLDENDQQVISGAPHEVATFWHHCVGSIEKEMRANAALVVAVVNALPALLDERDRLIAEVEKLKLGVKNALALLEAEGIFIAADMVKEEIASARQALSQEIG